MEVEMEVSSSDDEEMQVEVRPNQRRPDGEGSRFVEPALLAVLCEYLNLNDLKSLRLVSPECNSIINEHPAFISQNVGSISAKWYATSRGTNRSNIIQWTHFKLNHFAFHRNLNQFRLYWKNIGSTITTLTMSNSSFECDGFAFILNQLPKLTTLVMSGIKLRDLDNYHSPVAIQMAQPAAAQGDPQLPQQPNRCLENFEQPLRHLTIDNCNYMENCMLEYLINRTGRLESLTLTSCFNPKTSNAYVHRQTTRSARRMQNLNQRLQNAGENVNALNNVNATCDVVEKTKLIQLFQQFKYYFKHLLERNTTTLKKLTVGHNSYSYELYALIAGIPNIQLQELNVAIGPEEKTGLLGIRHQIDNIPIVLKLINRICTTELAKLALEFHDKSVTNEQLTNLLTPVAPRLHNLKITYNSSKLAEGVELDLSQLIQQMQRLESLELHDTKDVKKSNIKPLLRQPLKISEARREEILNTASSKISMNMLFHLPATIRHMKFDRIITRNNFTLMTSAEELLQLQYAAGFGALSTFELKGPWIHLDIEKTIAKILTTMRQLTSLSIVNCNVTDAHLTGLSHEGARELRKSNLYMTPLYTNMGEGRNPYLRLIAQPIFDPNTGHRKAALSDMRALQHLDLSQNFGVTNITLAHSLCNNKIPGLKSLNLSSCPRINDLGLELIGAQLKKLEELNVKHCRGISKVGLNLAVNGCKRLKRLYVTKRVCNAAGVNQLKDQGLLNIPLNQHYNEIIRTSDEEDPMKNQFNNEDSSDDDEDA